MFAGGEQPSGRRRTPCVPPSYLLYMYRDASDQSLLLESTSNGIARRAYSTCSTRRYQGICKGTSPLEAGPKVMSSKLSKATTLALLTGGGTSAAALAWFLLRQRPKDTDDNADSPPGDEVLEAGMLLLEHARDVPGLLPIAFLVSAIVKSSEHSGHSDTTRFARLIETLEVLLLQASSLPLPLLAQLTTVLEQAEVRVRGGSTAARSFASLAGELQTCVNHLEFEESPLEVDPRTLFATAVFSAADGAEAATALNSVAVDALIEDSRRAQTADEEQMRLLAEQNQLLADQVSQMQKMLAQPTVAPTRER